jgi:hypothetical protein
VADVTGDGIADIVTADGSGVSVLASDRHGGFAPWVSYPVEGFPLSIAVADVTGDGVADIVTANWGSFSVSVLAGDGHGGFAPPVSYEVGGAPVFVAVADATGDGIADIVTVHNSVETASVLAGDGHGGFAPQVSYPVEGFPNPLVVADVSGDGIADIVAAQDNSGGGLSVRANTSTAPGLFDNTPLTTLATADTGVTIDTTAPDAPAIRAVAVDTHQVNGTAEPGSTVRLFDHTDSLLGSTTAAAAAGSWTLTILPGTYSLTATATDAAGNSSAASEAYVTDLPCFLAGTLILTPHGEVPVETLRAGDLVVTAGGERRPIRWVGSGCTLVTPRNRCQVAPVIVRTGALGVGVPQHDLFLTRQHAMRVGEVLVPVEHLINDISVLWDEQARVITYYHLELDRHDILLAEGAPAESFRDNNSAELFQNSAARPPTAPLPSCLPVVETGAALDRAWAEIAARIAPLPPETWTADADLHLLVDGRRVDPEQIDGACVLFALPPAPRSIEIVSRTTIPAAAGLGPDLRRLGVALGAIRLHSDGTCHTLDLADLSLTDGFAPFEHGHRWTRGRAGVPAVFTTGLTQNRTCLELQVCGSLRYRPAVRMPALATDDPDLRRAN